MQDVGQKNILSFFQKKSNSSSRQPLFTEHGNNTFSRTATKLDTCIVIDDDSEDFKTTKSNKSSGKVSVTNTKGCFKSAGSEKSSSISVEINGAMGQESSLVECVPETQLLFTPPGQHKQASEHRLLGGSKLSVGTQDSTDSGLIPDTPNDKKPEIAKSKHTLGRSFLLSSAQIASNPIQKAKENRQAKLVERKQARQAKQGLTSVAVNFNNVASTPANSSTTAKCHSEHTSSLTGIKPTGRTDIDEPQDVDVKTGDQNTSDVTPTKVYTESFSVKRMAKEGLSPHCKRKSNAEERALDSETNIAVVKQLGFHSVETRGLSSTDQSKVATARDIDEKLTNGRTNQELVKGKWDDCQNELQEDKLLEMKLVRKEERKRNSEKILKYQLTGNTGLVYLKSTFVIHVLHFIYVKKVEVVLY